jgi:hypothetical protein
MNDDTNDMERPQENVGDIHDFANEKIGDRLNSIPEEELYSGPEVSPEVKHWMDRFLQVFKENEELKTEVKELNEAFGTTSDEADQYCADLDIAKKRIVLLELALEDMSRVFVAPEQTEDRTRVLKQAEELLDNKATAHVIVLDEEAKDEILRILKENTVG